MGYCFLKFIFSVKLYRKQLTNRRSWDVYGCPVCNTSPSKARSVDSILTREIGSHMPFGQTTKKVKWKVYCKFNKHFKNGSLQKKKKERNGYFHVLFEECKLAQVL